MPQELSFPFPKVTPPAGILLRFGLRLPDCVFLARVNLARYFPFAVPISLLKVVLISGFNIDSQEAFLLDNILGYLKFELNAERMRLFCLK